MTTQKKKTTGVVILPSDALPTAPDHPSAGETQTNITAIQYPNDVDATALVPMYAVRKRNKTTMIAEILRFASPFGSWFFVPHDTAITPDVCSNGNITMVTAVDPLFCALLLLDARRAVGQTHVFQPLDSLCVTADGTDLSQVCDASQFSMLCNVKEAAGSSFYKLSDEKTMSWLLAKHQALAKHPDISSKDALDILTQYVTPKWEKLIRKQVLGDPTTTLKDAKTLSMPSQNLALESMMEDAKETNATMRNIPDMKLQTPALKKKKMAAKGKTIQKAPSASFWGTRGKSTSSQTSKKGLKRTRSNSSTK